MTRWRSPPSQVRSTSDVAKGASAMGAKRYRTAPRRQVTKDEEEGFRSRSERNIRFASKNADWPQRPRRPRFDARDEPSLAERETASLRKGSRKAPRLMRGTVVAPC